MPPGAIYVGRPTRWGNPLYAGFWKGYTKADAVRDFERWIRRDLSVSSFDNAFGIPPTIQEIIDALAGHDLACWCKPGDACHADVLLAIANHTKRKGRD